MSSALIIISGQELHASISGCRARSSGAVVLVELWSEWRNGVGIFSGILLFLDIPPTGGWLGRLQSILGIVQDISRELLVN